MNFCHDFSLIVVKLLLSGGRVCMIRVFINQDLEKSDKQHPFPFTGLYKQSIKPIYIGLVQKHEKEIPGLFQGNSRTFFSFQGLNFSQFLVVFAGNGDSEIGRTLFLSPEYFHYGIDKYRDYR